MDFTIFGSGWLPEGTLRWKSRLRHGSPVTIPARALQGHAPDPLLIITKSAYGYVDLNPTTFVDPSGLSGWYSTGSCSLQNPVGCVKTVGSGLQDGADWLVEHRDAIATGTAIGVCLIPGVGWGGCAAVGTVALGFRAQKRAEDQGGWSEAMWANVADAFMTWATLGLGGAFSLAGDGAPAAEYLSRLIPAIYDFFGTYGSSLAELCEGKGS